jgi:hypothetical protein
MLKPHRENLAMQKQWFHFLQRLSLTAIVVGLIASLASTPMSSNAVNTFTTSRVSVSSDGLEGNSDSESPSISADGRFVVYSSLADNLVENDNNDLTDIFIHDRDSGETNLVTTSWDGLSANSLSFSPDISLNGRYVAFDSYATNLVNGDTNDTSDIFVYDNVEKTITRVSVSSLGYQSDKSSSSPSISADGRYVAFDSYATNLVIGDSNVECYYFTSPNPTNCPDIFVHDRTTGTTIRVSVNSDGVQGNGYSYSPDISSDGQLIVFESRATNLVGDEYLECNQPIWGNCIDIFVHDQVTGITKRVSVSSDGVQGNDGSYSPSMSSDGRYVAFSSDANNLVSDDTNGVQDVFVHDLETKETKRVSISTDGFQGNDWSGSPRISADGRYVAFSSNASNLVAGDNNNRDDIFVHDIDTGVTSLISVSTEGVQGNDWSGSPAISNNGRHVAYGSEATNLVSGDTNGMSDVFMHEIDGAISPPVGIDLDVYDSSISIQDDGSLGIINTKQKQPKQIVVKGSVSNQGAENAQGVSVNLWDGKPPTGKLLSTTQNITVNSGETISVPLEWIVQESGIQANLFLEVIPDPDQPDQNLSNNVSSSGTPAYVAFADYNFDPDTFSFENWKMTLTDFLAELVVYKFHLTPDVWRYIAGPVLYATYGLAGHCYGMAQASIIYWDTPSVKPVPIDTFAMEPWQVALDIHDQHVRQLLLVETKDIATLLNPSLFSPANAYARAKQRLSLNDAKPSILAGFFDDQKPDGTWYRAGHAVVAYKVVEIGNEKNIFVYDNRNPMSKSPSDIGAANIFTLRSEYGDFEYFESEYWDEAIALDPIRDPNEITAEMIEDIYEAIVRDLASQNKILSFFSWGGSSGFQNIKNTSLAPNHFVVVDDYGHKIGYENGLFVNQIPGAEFSEFESGFLLYLPASGAYTLNTIGTGNTNLNLSLAVPVNSTEIQETVFTDFEISYGVNATTTFSQETSDWRIKIDGSSDVLPTTNQRGSLLENVYLPILMR